MLGGWFRAILNLPPPPSKKPQIHSCCWQFNDCANSANNTNATIVAFFFIPRACGGCRTPVRLVIKQERQSEYGRRWRTIFIYWIAAPFGAHLLSMLYSLYSKKNGANAPFFTCCHREPNMWLFHSLTATYLCLCQRSCCHSMWYHQS